MDVTQEIIDQAKAEFQANGGVIRQLPTSINLLSKRCYKPCSWCGQAVPNSRHRYKLCMTCGKDYYRQISTKRMQLLQLSNFKKYQQHKAMLFKEGCR